MPKITLPNVNERAHVHIINPTAGDGRLFASVKRAVAQTGEKVRFTEKAGDAQTFCREEIAENPFVHLVIYGGDGTVHEAVNGILSSKSALTASFSVISAGSGNDFSAWVNQDAGYKMAELQHLDMLKTTDTEGHVRYFANSLNMGFDGQAAIAASRYKHQKGLRGSAAYIAGAAITLLKKKPVSVQLTLEGVRDFASAAETEPVYTGSDPLHLVKTGDRLTITGEILLASCANGPYCGGGFHSAPLASMTDGLMDVLVVQNLTRTRFVSQAGHYRTGTYIAPDGRLIDSYRGTFGYFQCRRVHIVAEEPYCLDGDAYPAPRELTVEVLPQAIWYAPL